MLVPWRLGGRRPHQGPTRVLERRRGVSEMKPLVSILIPAFNAQEWIGETIESALGQSWPRKEIIIVDDGSTDATLAVARRYESAE
jgi:cellulose synthase/poly-beta-1,6-N-acetylglucosamine synthase-like glycosyltransferase